MSIKRALGRVGIVLSVAAMVAGCDNPAEDGPDRRNPDGTGGNSALVGYWLMDEEENREKRFIRFEASGIYSGVTLLGVERFWIEGAYHLGSWYTEDQFLWYDRGSGFKAAQYNISGNRLTITECWFDEDTNEEDCYTDIVTKSDFDAIKRSLGTVYSADPALSLASAPRTDLEWVLQGDDNQMLEFWGMGFYDNRCHYSRGDEENYCNGLYYTTGSRLVLLYYGDEVESGCDEYGDDGTCYSTWSRSVVDMNLKVELDYNITGTGANRALELRRIFSTGAPSNTVDRWQAVEHSWDDYDYASAKSRQLSRQPSALGRSIFSPRQHP